MPESVTGLCNNDRSGLLHWPGAAPFRSIDVLAQEEKDAVAGPRRTDNEKTAACVAAVAVIALTGKTHSGVVGNLLRERLGAGWTIVSALQWLTGKHAWQCIEATPDGGHVGEYPKAVAIEMVRIAAATCREFDASAGSEAAIERVRVLANTQGQTNE